MSLRKFTALGTASQVPNTRCNQHGSFLKWDTEGFLFDPGEGTQRQMIYAGISASDITKIFITHFHGDHCLGLPSILQRISLDRVQHTVDIYFPASGTQYFENIRGISSFYDAAKIKPCPVETAGVIFEGRDLTISAGKLEHTIDTFGYRIEEYDSVNFQQDKLNARGISGPDVRILKEKRVLNLNGADVTLEDVSIIKQGQIFAFVMDTKFCPAAVELARKADLLVAESTFKGVDEDKATRFGHLTATQAAQIAKDAGAKKLLLTHFSQRYTPPNDDFESEAREVFPNTIQMKDKMSFILERQKRAV